MKNMLAVEKLYQATESKLKSSEHCTEQYRPTPTDYWKNEETNTWWRNLTGRAGQVALHFGPNEETKGGQMSPTSCESTHQTRWASKGTYRSSSTQLLLTLARLSNRAPDWFEPVQTFYRWLIYPHIIFNCLAGCLFVELLIRRYVSIFLSFIPHTSEKTSTKPLDIRSLTFFIQSGL